jgi:hypothetical protein
MITPMKFADVKDPADRLSEEFKGTFANQAGIEPILIGEEEKIWRFVHTKNGRRFSHCWVSPDTMNGLMGLIRNWTDYSEGAKKKIIRDKLAIMEDWKTTKVSWRLQITFKKPVIGYRGTTAVQQAFESAGDMFGAPAEKRTELRRGGFEQIVIPRFAGISTELGSEYASMTHFVHI